jgi:hypothetical protein
MVRRERMRDGGERENGWVRGGREETRSAESSYFREFTD